MVGEDIGGTFTGCVTEVDGRLVRGKAFSTHPDVTTGILDAPGVVAEELSTSAESGAERFVLANTIVTNAIGEIKLAAVGLPTTYRFADTLWIARSALLRGGER
jgi:N-methylhydantoinase A